ncbi:Putative importin 9 [Klebsormidium nitens]|uniref:Putative importin 9 n=1 Tax=Klebsormidium nitens TaxID=105231 RepID=A0A1Y1IFN8_KLENI|nr:Putative importin 9 [Klebsormidium nitens]|eukprot:GAQ87921.1 Putative importin 9 [Klebsormidium nitens]
MANTLDTPDGHAWLLQCLQGTLDANPAVRVSAETALKQAADQAGFGPALVKIVLSFEVPYGLRQLGAVVVKKYVKEHWQDGEKGFVGPVVSDSDKADVRRLLPDGLADAKGKIRTAVGMAVAAIARMDWPQEWPQLMDVLVTGIKDRGNVNRMQGSLRCLSLFAGDIDDAQMPRVIAVLFPELLAIVSSGDAYDPSIQRRALSIVHSCIATLGLMSGVYLKETRDLLAPIIPAWLDQFARLLAMPLAAEDMDNLGLKLEVIKTLQQVVQNFAKLAVRDLPRVLGALWQTYVKGAAVYEQMVVLGEGDRPEAYDSDGDELNLETFTVQLFEFLLTIVSNPRLAPMIEGSIGELVYYAVGYMRMTDEQTEACAADPNQYVADEEEETFSCRNSGGLLLEELIESFEERALVAIAGAAQQRMEEAKEAKAAGKSDWWKMREASILALGTCAERFIEFQRAGVSTFDIPAFQGGLLHDDLGGGNESVPFLRGRALWAAAKFADALPKEQAVPFLHAAVGALSEGTPPAIQISGCRALAQLCPKLDADVVRPVLPLVFSSLDALLKAATEETLHLVLETLSVAVRADGATAAAFEATISPAVLHVWAQYVTDPLISEDALDVLEALAEFPECIHPLFLRVVPSLAGVLAAPDQQPPGLVEGALDLLTLLLQRSPADVSRTAFGPCFGATARIVMTTDDAALLQSGAECLAAFVRSSGTELLQWGPAKEETMKTLLDATGRLLDPHMDSSASLYVGNLITQLVRRLPGDMGPHSRPLLAALVARMQSSLMPALTISLLLVVARLVHMSAPNVSQLIDALVSLPAQGYSNALSFVLFEWTKWHGEIQGAYQIKVSLTALATLLASGDPRLGSVIVQGEQIQPEEGGVIMTRSRAKQGGRLERYSNVSLPVKLIAILADTLTEMKEAQATGVEDDDEWEEASGDEDEDDEAGPSGIVISAGTGRSSVFQPIEDFANLFSEDFAEGTYVEDPDAKSDPINSVNVSEYAVKYLKELARRDQVGFAACCQGLNRTQQEAIHAALQTGS